MKKSYLIFLLCFLFCGQMLAQRLPTTPVNSKGADAPVVTHSYEYRTQVDDLDY